MVVRMRINRSATRMRRSHQAIEGPRLSKCAECGAMRMRHRACIACGKYRGRVVTDMAAKEAKKAGKRIQALEAKHAIPHEHEKDTAKKDTKSTKQAPAAKATKKTRTTSK